MNSNQLLRCKFYKVDNISVKKILCMFNIFDRYYENANLETFTKDLSKKTGAFIVTNKSSGKIVGFSTWAEYEFDYKGKKALGIFSGDTILEKAYWGDKSLQNAFGKRILILAILNLYRPAFWLLISKGYKTYMLLANNFYVHYPHYKNKYPHLKAAVNEYAKFLYPEYFNPETGLLDFGETYQRLKGDVASISDEERQNPKIEFFEKINPTWDKGTELICIGSLSIASIYYYMKKQLLISATKLLKTKKSNSSIPVVINETEDSLTPKS